jgi:hypothetical protein
MIIKSGFTRLSITKNTTDSLNIYYGRLCYHQEFHVTPDDDIDCRNIYILSESVVFFVILNLGNPDFIIQLYIHSQERMRGFLL